MTVADTFHLHKGHSPPHPPPSPSLSLSPLPPLSLPLLYNHPRQTPRLFDSRLIFIGNQVASSFTQSFFLYFSLLHPLLSPPHPPHHLKTHTRASPQQRRTELGDFFCQLGVLFNLISLFLSNKLHPPLPFPPTPNVSDISAWLIYFGRCQCNKSAVN